MNTSVSETIRDKNTKFVDIMSHYYTHNNNVLQFDHASLRPV